MRETATTVSVARNRRLIRGLTGSCILVATLVVILLYSVRSAPPGSEVFGVRQVELQISNPRKIGTRLYLREDGTEGTTPSSAAKEYYYYPVHMIVLAELADGNIILPVYQTRSPRFGPLGGVHTERAWSRSDYLLARSRTWQRVEFPYRNDVSGYFILLKEMDAAQSLEREGQWSVFEIEVSSVIASRQVPRVRVPELSKLPLLQEHPFAREILNAVALLELKDQPIRGK